MTVTDQSPNDNNDKNNITIYLNPIFECLDGCCKCEGTYFSTAINDYSLCKCTCHKEQNSVRLISDSERIQGPETFAEMIYQYLKSGGHSDVI